VFVDVFIEMAVTSLNGRCIGSKEPVSRFLLLTYMTDRGGRSVIVVGSTSVQDECRSDEFINLTQCCSWSNSSVNCSESSWFNMLCVLVPLLCRLFCSIFIVVLRIVVFLVVIIEL
jgi:hypothetical protein